MEKLGQEPAFPCLEYNENGNGNVIVLSINGERNIIPFKEGMSKRFYAACAAMNIPNELLKVEIIDEDVEQSDDGYYVKNSFGYHCSNNIDMYEKEERYKLKTNYNYKLVRAYLGIADELLKQEFNDK